MTSTARPIIALATIRWRRRDWRVCPWIAIRAALISSMVVGVVVLVLDHWVLASLERHGLVAADGWKHHNRIVVANHHRKDRVISFPKPKWASSAGVRAWHGFPVTKERAKQHRLLVMGDSYIWESPYFTLNHMWWRQLEIELQRRGYQDVEVNAAGCSGMSTHDELDLARHVVPEFKPDLILWGYVTNDPDERVIKQLFSSQFALPIPGKIQVVLQKFVPRLFDLLKSRRSEKLGKSYVGAQYGYEYPVWVRLIHEGENLQLYQQTVSAVAQFLKDLEKDYPQFLGPKSTPLASIRINDWLPYDLEVKSISDRKFELTYPDTTQLMPTMPLEIPTAMVAFEQPVVLSEIRLTGNGLKSGRAWISVYDPNEFYDTQVWTDLGAIDGKEIHWKIPADLARRKASVIRFKAEVDATDRRLELELTPGEDPEKSVGDLLPR